MTQKKKAKAVRFTNREVDIIMVAAMQSRQIALKKYEDRKKRLQLFLRTLAPCGVIADALDLQLRALQDLGFRPSRLELRKRKKRGS